MAERGNKLTERAKRRVGTILNSKWTLERLLGVGGMAAVYVATHRNKKRAAIKVLHTEMSADPDVQARFLREGYVANSVEHPGAVRVDDDDVTEDGAAYLVMELLEGETIETRWIRKRKRLPLNEVLWIADQLLDIVAAAHSRGIVHRDIKPENLFLTFDGQLKVLDFGIARLRETGREITATQTGKSMGTPAYMAPEQARGRWADVDARTDLWAIGATLFALLTGHLVHEAETSNEALGKAMRDPARPIRELSAEIPEGVADAIDRALEFSRRRRFSSARDMREALRAASHGAELATPAVTFPLRGAGSTFRGVRVSSVAGPSRSGWRVGLAIGSGAAAVATIVALFSGGARRDAPADAPPPPRSSARPRPEVTPAPIDDVLDVVPLPPSAAPRAEPHPTAAPALPPPRPTLGPGPSSLPSGDPPASSATPALSSRCTPPYYLDERGIKRFRPECL